MTMIEQAMDSQGHESIQKDTREEHNASASKSVLVKGINGNASITLYADGTRIIDYPGEDAQIIDLEYPLNVDIKLSSRCAFGMDPRTQKAVCSFCHESARTDGIEGDYERLETILSVLPLTTEIALGINEVTEDLIQFLSRLKQQGRIVNGTFNQGLIRTGAHRAITDQKLLNGIGISWRRASWGIDDPIYLDPNTVLHVIAGIDDFDEISDVIKAGAVRKLLILGEKDFGFNQGNVDIKSPSHLKWQKKLHELFEHALISFDNLAIEQLRVRRYFGNKNWSVFHQGERSIYLDAVKKVFAPSSRSNETVSWGSMNLQEYWNTVKIEKQD